MSLAHFRIFVSSPGDVPDERIIAADVIDNLRYDSFLRNKVTVEIVAWDRPGAPPMEANIPPQEAINSGLPLPSVCDIVIVIFWTRMGTPLVIKGRSYLSGTEFEYREATENRGENGLPSVLVYRRTEDVAYSPKDSEYLEKYKQFQKVDTFFLREFTDINTGGLSGGYNPYETPNDFRSLLSDHLKHIIHRTLENNIKQKSNPKHLVEKPKLWQGSPFPGLRAFTGDDEAIFFGRGVETDKLVQRVRDDNFVAVVGASGSGKSSLVSAGLLPRIRKTSGMGKWTILTITPDILGTGDPFGALTDSITQVYPDKSLVDSIQQAYRNHSLTIVIDKFLGDNTDTRFLLFIDQFEELFTTIERKLALKYIQLMINSLADERLHIVITVRGDFYNNCIEIKELAEILQGSTFPLAAPKRDALRMMIELPTERAGLKFEDNSLVTTILDDTGDSAGALALLAYLLDELYHRRSDANIMKNITYKDLDGVQGAIGRRSEQTYEKLSDEEQSAMIPVFRELVSVKQDGTVTRRRTTQSAIAQEPSARAFIKAMVDARLLVVNRGRDNQSYVEVAHEALLHSWDRLANWINETQSDLRKLQEMRQAAAEWNNTGRQDYRLWKHELLQPIYDMQKRLNVEFTEVEDAFTKPESERLLKEFKGYQAGRLRDAMWRQRHIVARLSEIGVTTIPTRFMCLAYSSGKGVKIPLMKELRQQKLSDILEQIEISIGSLNQIMHRDNVRDFIWYEYLEISRNSNIKPPSFEDLFLQRPIYVEGVLQETLQLETHAVSKASGYDSNNLNGDDKKDTLQSEIINNDDAKLADSLLSEDIEEFDRIVARAKAQMSAGEFGNSPADIDKFFVSVLLRASKEIDVNYYGASVLLRASKEINVNHYSGDEVSGKFIPLEIPDWLQEHMTILNPSEISE